MKLYPLTSKQVPSKKECILVIDNEWNILKLMHALLSPKFDVVVKNSTVDALHWIVNSKKKPALIVTEYDLPCIDGAEFIKHLKYSGLFNDIPIIILTSNEVADDKTAGLTFYANAVIAKPFNPSALILRINTLIDEHRSQTA